MYAIMSFGLMNASATFQRVMNIAFVGDKFVVIYLDDITVFSKSDEEHLDHLKMNFEKCRRFRLSLNPKKSIFALEEGKLLGHIVSRDGVKIDPTRVQAVQKIPLPRSKKVIQKFLRKINFLKRFVSNYAEIVKEITNMLKKENEVHWTREAIEPFSRIKEALQAAPVLISPNYQNPFQVFSFASPNSIVVVLLQKNDEEKEQPVAFFSKILRDVELKYNILEKQVYALVKALKAFRNYVLQSQIIAYVPNAAVKYVLVQGDVEGKRGKCIAKIQEYDLDIKPTKLVKGQRKC